MLVHYNLEANSENNDASCVVLYYDGDEPSREQVVADLTNLRGSLPLACDTNDPYFEFAAYPTPVSERAGLWRLECTPCG